MRRSRVRSILFVCALFAAFLTVPQFLLAQARPGRNARAAAHTAQPSTPYDAFLRERAAAVEQNGRSPRALLELFVLWGAHDYATPKVTSTILESLSKSTRLSAANRAYVAGVYALSLAHDGRQADAQRTRDTLNRIRAFRVIGAFDNEGKTGFDRAMPPEENRVGPVDMAASYPGRERAVSWRMYPDLSHTGRISFDSVLRPNNNVCGFAETFVHVDNARPLTLWLGAGGAVKAYWNGEVVLRDETYRGAAEPDRAAAKIDARHGWNRLLIKECVADHPWAFFARIGEMDGAPARGVRYDAMNTEPLGEPATPSTLSAKGPLAYFEEAAAGDHPSAESLENLARYLRATGSDDPSEKRAKQLAARAADEEPNVDRLLLACQLADERAQIQKYAAKLEALAPSDPRVLAELARVKSQGTVPEDAIAIIARIPDNNRAYFQGQLLKANLLHALGMNEDYRATIDAIAARTNGAVAFLRARIEAANATGRRDLAMTLHRELLAVVADDIGEHKAMVADAVARGDMHAAIEEVEIVRGLAPESVSNLAYVATVYDALGRDDDVIAAYRQALELLPEDAPTHVALGHALLRLDQREAASDEFHRAMILRPQDANTRELLEQIHPETRQDEAYAVASDELLARRTPTTDYPISYLEQLTVKTVYPNGLASTFTQVATQINDEEGARRNRTFSLQYDPGSQRVDIRLARVYRANGQRLEANHTFEQQLGEPAYRIYYDTRAMVIVFPDLDPGDVVEVRYRIDDVSHSNVFADYFGDLHYLQESSPIKNLDYVLITPKSREFFFNDPQMPTLHHVREEEGANRIDRFTAEDIAAFVPEDGMPGITDLVPYLHVSTYRTWQDVAHWWWGLVHEQFYADDSLKHTVATLVAGAHDNREKVARIYDWVLTHTRYVGLEFGIHGYLPYRVPDIIQRGFGDCKDKASLLYTMLREANIDARVVLVRTRRNGSIKDLPASLAVFDHAIAYVPEFDLFLDGTADHNGSGELPEMDQGVTVLVIGPNSAELRRTPTIEAANNIRDRHINVHLDTAGDATIRVTESIKGNDASGYRGTYEAEGTRRERFERQLSTTFAGASLKALEMSDLHLRENPIRVTYDATVPHLAQRNGASFTLAPSVLSDLLRGLARTSTRRYPLDLGAAGAYTEERVVSLDAGLTFEAPPEGGEANSPFGRLKLSYTRNGAELIAHTDFAILKDRVSVEEYGAFRAWVEQVDALLRQRVTVGGAR